MSIPKAIFDKIGDILDVIQELSPSRNPLIKIYQAYKHPLAFINKYMRDFPSSSREWAGKIYRAVRYFAEQGETLGDMPYDTPLDPRLAGKIPAPGDSPLNDFGYRYNIQFNIDAPGVGQQHTFNFWVNSNYLWSHREIVESAMPSVVSLLDRYRLSFNEGDPNYARITATEIQGFVQYIPGLSNG